MITVGRKPNGEYIGRGSPLGNPFPINASQNRDAVCNRYQEWFDNAIQTKDPLVLGELRRLYVIAKRKWHMKCLVLSDVIS
jgi:hypothetical protein